MQPTRISVEALKPNPTVIPAGESVGARFDERDRSQSMGPYDAVQLQRSTYATVVNYAFNKPRARRDAAHNATHRTIAISTGIGSDSISSTVVGMLSRNGTLQ